MNDDDTLSIEEFRARFTADHAAKRAQAHADVDAHFDQVEQLAVAQLELIERDLAGVKSH